MKKSPNEYRGKNRIYENVKSQKGISRIKVWNPDSKRYEIPGRGSLFQARRRRLVLGKGRVREFGYFDSLDEALNWQSAPDCQTQQKGRSVTFESVVSDWRKRKLEQKAFTTKIHYEKMLRLYFRKLMQIEMKHFNVQVVDAWIAMLKEPGGAFMKAKRRISFDHELSLLKGILNFYRDYLDNEYNIPILKRHSKDILTGRKRPFVRKGIEEDEFVRFQQSLQRLFGATFTALATIQYFQGYRISEAAGLHWEDFQNLANPRNAKVFVTKSIVWPRAKGTVSFIQEGFKNSKSNHGVKVQPVFPQTYRALMQIHRPGASGLIFKEDGRLIEYRRIEYVYNTALKDAKVPLTATHILRHGATCRVYNSTKGDIEVAGQLLGNTDRQTVLTYAKRDPKALTQVAHQAWDEDEKLRPLGEVIAFDRIS